MERARRVGIGIAEARTVDRLNIMKAYFSDFSKGILDIPSVLFFLTVTVFFLFLSVKILESRRWR